MCTHRYFYAYWVLHTYTFPCMHVRTCVTIQTIPAAFIGRGDSAHASPLGSWAVIRSGKCRLLPFAKWIVHAHSHHFCKRKKNGIRTKIRFFCAERLIPRYRILFGPREFSIGPKNCAWGKLHGKPKFRTGSQNYTKPHISRCLGSRKRTWR